MNTEAWCERIATLWSQRVADLKLLQQTKQDELLKYKRRIVVVQDQIDSLVHVEQEANSILAEVKTLQQIERATPAWVAQVKVLTTKSDASNLKMKSLINSLEDDLQKLLSGSYQS